MTAQTFDFFALSWPAARLGELLENLARRSKYSTRPFGLPQPPDHLLTANAETLGAWLDVAAGRLGLEMEPIDAGYTEVEDFLRVGGPAILRLPHPAADGQTRLLALLKSDSKRARLLGPDLKVHKVQLGDLGTALTMPFDVALTGEIEQLLDEAGVPQGRRARAQKAILQEQLGSVRVEMGWLLRLPPGVSLARQFRHNGGFRPAILLLLTYFLLQILSIAAWFVIGRGVFQGHFDLGWLIAWGLLLLATIPLQMLTSDAQGELSMAAGAIFRQRLLHGTLQLEPEEIRHQGMGQFLGRVMESEAVEMLALSGGFLAALSFMELGLAAVILANGAGQMFSVALLGVWVLLTVFLLWQYVKANLEWANAYREMTNDLVERMVGHRTRLAQEDRRHWHDEEDQMLDRYLKLSQDVDEKAIWLSSLVTRGWMLVGLGSLALPFVQGGASVPALAISLGGVLFAMQALAKLSGGVQSLAALLTAWQQVGPLFSASSRPRELQAVAVSPADAEEIGAALAQNGAPEAGEATATLPKNGGGPLVQARDLVFRYRPQGRPVLENCNLQIFAGDRILLEGPSGGGKSTLASLLTGLRKPEAGSLLLQGYDRQILGAEAWRERVVMAPQFQENHVFTETFAFNLLMGRRWPPRPEDLQDAEEICRELGLGDLLERMPSGFQQMLGESGWRLSHGERSRLYIARTLLQKADLIILDESFGALDPENLNRALRCVLNRAPTLLVIAHP